MNGIRRSAWTDPTTLALLGASAGFLDPQGGMQAGFRGAMQGLAAGHEIEQMNIDRQDKQRALLQQIEAQDFLQKHSGLKPSELTQKIMTTGNPILMAQAKNILAMQPKAKQFVKVLDEKGVTRYQPAFETGEFGDMSAAPVAEKLAFQNLGDRVTGVDPYTGKQVIDYAAGMRPGEQERLNLGYANLNQSARQHADNIGMQQQRMAFDMNPDYQAMRAANIETAKLGARNKVTAIAELPQAIDKANESIKLIDDLIEHPGFKISVGKSAPIGKVASMYPGTDASDFARRMEQIKGQQFLQAFETLKGGGQITEIEGTKATQAISRMDTAQSEQEFKAAAQEFKDIIQRGVQRARQKAGVTNNDGWGELR